MAWWSCAARPATHPVAERVLSRRALNRALLARQLLLRRSKLAVPAALEHLVGLQAQLPLAPYVGLWSRLAGFAPDTLSRLLEERQVVRLTMFRGTLHLVTGRDALALRPLLRPLLERMLAGGAYGRRIAGLDVHELVAAARAIVDEKPRSGADLGAALQERWPDRDGSSLSHAVRHLLPMVQIPPRGVWGKSAQARWASLETWLDRPLGPGAPLDELLTRYLGAFGPASAADAQAWSGLPKLRESFERLRPGLRVFRDEAGRELFDLAAAPRPSPETEAPVRFLPEYDNLILGYADRTRVISEAHRRTLAVPNAVSPGTFLVDGFVAGTWRIARAPGSATLSVTPLVRLRGAARTAVLEEGARLLELAAAEVTRRDVIVR